MNCENAVFKATQLTWDKNNNAQEVGLPAVWQPNMHNVLVMLG
ncbi:hypothetical protein CRENPOLYSF1_100001 [Crenothrix polyspora]|uniref:Uncharacterized protein n=1 Tax=Crenothrix polyspora TaxID=360316 RepID=A0A1R4GYK2_9GAMM|nr:hypothetical protein CRENPOLYSF1_100001 [Crenothrix polyspora]